MNETNNISILKNCRCKDCGWPIIDACCNGQDFPFDQWDWWQYCSNMSCKNHFGEGVFQNEPEFIDHDDLKGFGIASKQIAKLLKDA
jgi:hypothetical protein